jgi:two-component system nitrogen regulation response regulator GlnG
MSALDNWEITLPEVEMPESSWTEACLCLTVLYHPQLDRIGEVASLEEWRVGREILLGRQQLEFSQPGEQHSARALLDPYLSRQPICLQFQRQAVELKPQDHSSSICVNRSLLHSTRRLSQAELADGVVIVLARRIVLYLHYAQAGAAAADNCGMVGASDSMQRIRYLIQRVAPTDTTVLLLGESGTGKELVARAIHQRSDRAAGKLVSVNMAAIPQELAAAELFGVRRGAFTGADADKDGFFSQADGSTLFLDEVGACVASIQPLLLRALEQGEVQPAGGVVESVAVRAIAATDARLDESDFSVALRHRLGGFEIHIPPLRQRREDIGRLLVHLLGGFMPTGADLDPIVAAQWALLVRDFACYRWPGNIRELINFTRQIEIASAGNDALVVPDNILQALLEKADSDPALSLRRRANEISSEEIGEAMLKAQWEISRTARKLQISRQALYLRIKSIPQIRIAADIPSAEVEAVYHDCNGELDSAVNILQVSRSGLRRRWRALELEPQER